MSEVYECEIGSRAMEEMFPDLGTSKTNTKEVSDIKKITAARTTTGESQNEKKRSSLKSTSEHGSGERSLAPTDELAIAKPIDAHSIMGCLNHHTVASNEYDLGEQVLSTTEDYSTEMEAAMDSGAVDNVVHPKHMPKDVQIEVNNTNQHFSDASGGVIIRHGKALVKLKDAEGNEMLCPTQVADVVRPLHSVSRTTGPPGPIALAGVVFTNNVGHVTPPGYAERLLKQMEREGAKPIATYKRNGNLYTAKMRMSSFTRPSAKQ